LTRAKRSRLAGREISRDVIGRLKRLDLVDGALRAPEPGAPFAYLTTRKFLEAFGLTGLHELSDLGRLEDEGLLQRPISDGDLLGARVIRNRTESSPQWQPPENIFMLGAAPSAARDIEREGDPHHGQHEAGGEIAAV
jgi:hypothetical protein